MSYVDGFVAAVPNREDNAAEKEKVFKYLVNQGDAATYNGELTVSNGTINTSGITFINARSFAEDVTVSKDGTPFNGSIGIRDGKVVESGYTFTGKSLIHSANLTIKAFTKGFFGEAGQYIVSIGILLFAFEFCRGTD